MHCPRLRPTISALHYCYSITLDLLHRRIIALSPREKLNSISKIRPKIPPGPRRTIHRFATTHKLLQLSLPDCRLPQAFDLVPSIPRASVSRQFRATVPLLWCSTGIACNRVDLGFCYERGSINNQASYCCLSFSLPLPLLSCPLTLVFQVFISSPRRCSYPLILHSSSCPLPAPHFVLFHALYRMLSCGCRC